MDHDELPLDEPDQPGRDEVHAPGGDAPPDHVPPVDPVEPVDPVDPVPAVEVDDDPYDLPDLPDLSDPTEPGEPSDLSGSQAEVFEAPDLGPAIELLERVDDDQLRDTGDDGSVDLPLDHPLDDGRDAQAVATDTPPDDAVVDLSLEPDRDDLDAAPEDEAERPDVVDLPLGEEAQSPFEVAEGNAWLTSGLIAAALVAIGASAPVLARLHRASPPDVAAHLDQLGIDARVDHLDLTGLEELLAGGRTVLLSTDGSAGVDPAAVLQLRELDRASGRAVVSHPTGARSSVDLAVFEAAWSDSANQVVVAAGTDGSVALVPVVLAADDLVTTR